MRNFNTSLLPIERSSKLKLKREILDLRDVINQTFYQRICISPNTKEYTLFSEFHGTFSKMDHILRHKASLNQYKKIEMTLCILSYHYGLKLDINNHRNNRKLVTSRKLNNFPLNEIWVKTKMNNEIKNFLEFNANE